MITEFSVSLSEILVAVMTIIATAFGFIIREQREKIKTIQHQLSDKKYGLYYEIFNIFFDMFKKQKGSKNADESELVIKLIDINKDLFIYSPDEVVQKFLEWKRQSSENPSDVKHIHIFLELFVLIRKDMGNSKTKISELDILRSVMSTDEEFDKMRALLGK